jgi:hypothetical protein
MRQRKNNNRKKFQQSDAFLLRLYDLAFCRSRGVRTLLDNSSAVFSAQSLKTGGHAMP